VKEKHNSCTYVKAEDECYCVFIDAKDKLSAAMLSVLTKVQLSCDFFEFSEQTSYACAHYNFSTCGCECGEARLDQISASKWEDI